jgi:hypothetical protein
LLVENYHALLAVLDDVNASRLATATKTAVAAPGLSQRDGVIFKDGRPYRGVGANYYDLFLRLLHNPTNTTSLDGLKQLGAAGIPFVRFGLGYNAADWNMFFNEPDKFFRAFDQVVQTAEREHVGLIPSFFWRFKVFPDLAGEPCDQWGNPDSKTTALARQLVGAVIERYKNSPAIWAWEFGNEPNLAADLPNAAQFRKKGGTERDDLTSAAMVVMLSGFAQEIRRHDDHRLIIAGNSHPRAASWHNTAEKSWKPDSREQTLEILRRDNPAPLDTIGIHVYADYAVSKELAGWATNHTDYLRPIRELAVAEKRPLFIGEFGLASKGDEAATRVRFEKLLADIGAAGADLAAVWVFDLKDQNKLGWNATFNNNRAYMLKLVAEANRRWNQAALTSAR